MTAISKAAKGEPFVSEAPRLGFVGGFDGMRGIGVVIVLLGHIFPEGTDSFNPIVDVFFVISAFLIVSLLMQERRQNGRIDLRRFYTRRALRLLPNSYACMAAWLLVFGLVKLSGVKLNADGLEQVNAIPGNVAAAATYTRTTSSTRSVGSPGHSCSSGRCRSRSSSTWRSGSPPSRCWR